MTTMDTGDLLVQLAELLELHDAANSEVRQLGDKREWATACSCGAWFCWGMDAVENWEAHRAQAVLDGLNSALIEELKTMSKFCDNLIGKMFQVARDLHAMGVRENIGQSGVTTAADAYIASATYVREAVEADDVWTR